MKEEIKEENNEPHAWESFRTPDGLSEHPFDPANIPNSPMVDTDEKLHNSTDEKLHN